MLRNFVNNIKQKPESKRDFWALALSFIFTALIFVSFGFYKGFISFGGPAVKPSNQVANVVAAEQLPSPVESTKETVMTGLRQIEDQYKDLKDSLSNVFVPFFTGIEVYESK